MPHNNNRTQKKKKSNKKNDPREGRVPRLVLSCQNETLKNKAIQVYMNPKASKRQKSQAYRDIIQWTEALEASKRRDHEISETKKIQDFLLANWSYCGWF